MPWGLERFQQTRQTHFVTFCCFHRRASLANGKRVARVDLATGAVHFYISDHLGSATVIASQDGSRKEAESDYYPYGVESVIVADTTANHYKFTGKERDPEDGLDYFGARFYSSALGRFLTPDWSATPVLVPYAILGNPQTLNLYSYVENNPITGTDPDGHAQQTVANDPNGYEACQGGNGATCGTAVLEPPPAETLPLVEAPPQTTAPAPPVTEPGPNVPPAVAIPSAVLTGGAIIIGLEVNSLINSSAVQTQAAADMQMQSVSNSNVQAQAANKRKKENDESRVKPHRKNRRKSTYDDHTTKRPGTSPPPNYKPDRRYQQPKDDKKRDREKPPYFRKDRDPLPN